ncbi:hypothetical protein ACQ4PT_009581 [Festuca glaucescens]
MLSCVAAFARRGRRGALVLGATGRVADVVLCMEPSPLELRGTAAILGLAGCFFPPSASPAGVVVFLERLQGAVLGGGLAEGGLVAAWTIVVMVATFDRLPLLKGMAWPNTGGVMAYRCSSSPVPDASAVSLYGESLAAAPALALHLLKRWWRALH